MKKVLKFFLQFLLTLFVTILTVLIVLVLSIFMITHGPSQSAKNIFVTTVLETGQMKWLVGMFMDEDEINEIVNMNSMEVLEEDTDEELIEVPAEIENLEDINVYYEDGDNFSAIMMVVNDPSRVFVGTTYPFSEYGKELDQIVSSYGALGGINGGLYESTLNKGGYPYGIVVSNGEIQNTTGLANAGLVLIGMSENNILKIIDINGMGEAQVLQIVQDEQIRDAVCFQEEASDSNNHFVKLIINGEKRLANGMGSGANPRTAIGQTADGKMLLLVTDGRGSSGHLGATATDLIEIMEKYEAVNAANLDGGSSSSMFYDGEYLQTSVTLYYSNSSWRIPTSWLVR